MLDIHYTPTPNGQKVVIAAEELGVPYRIVPIDTLGGQQFDPGFLALNPNAKTPAVVDHGDGSAAPVTLFESGAILLHLAETHGRFLPPAGQARAEVLQWLFWQMAGLGPMMGQRNHWARHAPRDAGLYGPERYGREATRLLTVLDHRLEAASFVGGEAYSIADMACYPWARIYGWLGLTPQDLPALQAWLDRVAARPAVARAYEVAGSYPLTPRNLLPPARAHLGFACTGADMRRAYAGAYPYPDEGTSS